MGLFDDKLGGGPPPATKDAQLLDNLRVAEDLVAMWAWRSVLEDTSLEEAWEGCDFRLQRRARKFEIMASFYKRHRIGEERAHQAIARFEAMGTPSGLDRMVVAVLRCYLAIDSRYEARTNKWSHLAQKALDLAREQRPAFAAAFQQVCASLWEEYNRTGTFEPYKELNLGDDLLFAFLEMPAGFTIDPSMRPQLLPAQAPAAAPASQAQALETHPVGARILGLMRFVLQNECFAIDPATDLPVDPRGQAMENAVVAILAMPLTTPPAEWLEAAFLAIAPFFPTPTDDGGPDTFRRSLIGSLFANAAKELAVPSPVDWSKIDEHG